MLKKDIRHFNKWFERQDRAVKVTVILSITALLISLLIIVAINPAAGVAIVNILMAMAYLSGKGGNPPSLGDQSDSSRAGAK